MLLREIREDGGIKDEPVREAERERVARALKDEPRRAGAREFMESLCQRLNVLMALVHDASGRASE